MLWGKEVGSLYWDDRRKRSVFTYHPDFLNARVDIAPLSASIKNPRNRLPIYGLANDDMFCGLPAFIADSLPGRWGNAVFDAWAAENHIRASEITSVDKLLFIGKRGMGALEFVTFSAKSPKGKLAIEQGGTKMTQDALRQFVEDLFLPLYMERNK